MTDRDRFRELLTAGLEQARRGETVDLGDFAAYLTEKPPANSTMGKRLQYLIDLDAYLDDQAIGDPPVRPDPEHRR